MLFSAELPWCLVFVLKIEFLEKLRKELQSPYFPEDSRSQKMRRRGARGPTPPGSMVGPWPRHHMVWWPWAPPRNPLSTTQPLWPKNVEGITIFHETFTELRRHREPSSGGQKLRFHTLPGQGFGGDCRHHHHQRFSIDHPCFLHSWVSKSLL